jgi:hypothetical protein
MGRLEVPTSRPQLRLFDPMDENESRCAACGAAFHCGASGDAPCWCAGLPPVAVPEPLAGGCYCRRCLQQLLEKTPQST